VLKTVEGATAAISPESIVRKLPYAGLDLQEFVVENDVYQFQYFKHPHPKAIKLALDLLSQHNLVTPKWLAKIARAYKVPFQRIESDMIKDTRRNIEVLKNDVIQLQQRIKKLQDEWAVTEKELKASGEIKSIPILKVYYDKDIAKLQSQLENTQQRIKRDLAWIEKELNSN
jgi:cell division protein FtsB